jgi:hypothetical protein
MSSQIFKSEVPKDFLFNFLDSICIKNEKNYILNSSAFKKGIFNESINQFFKDIYNHYHNSKKKYLEKKLTYNSFITVIRQICNYHKITYTSEVKYDKSVYDIIYYIDFL